MIIAVGAIPVLLPQIAAYACPQCYGLQKAMKGVYVDAAMPAEDRAKLKVTINRAVEQVTTFYGSFDHRPTLLICSTGKCDRRLGGRGAKAVTYGNSFIRVSPGGLNQTILAHEYAHVELHARVGFKRLLEGAIPAWFDEGLAAVISDDPRYLKPGTTSATRCLASAEGALPADVSQWRRLAGKTPGLYAKAACRVMQWMEMHGGKAGLFEAIELVADGSRQLP